MVGSQVPWVGSLSSWTTSTVASPVYSLGETSSLPEVEAMALVHTPNEARSTTKNSIPYSSLEQGHFQVLETPCFLPLEIFAPVKGYFKTTGILSQPVSYNYFA